MPAIRTGKQTSSKSSEGEELLRSEGVNSFGIESAGRAQVRGNGNLALTRDEVLFAQWTTELGEEDSIALLVGDLEGWLEALGTPVDQS